MCHRPVLIVHWLPPRALSPRHGNCVNTLSQRWHIASRRHSIKAASPAERSCVGLALRCLPPDSAECFAGSPGNHYGVLPPQEENCLRLCGAILLTLTPHRPHRPHRPHFSLPALYGAQGKNASGKPFADAGHHQRQHPCGPALSVKKGVQNDESRHQSPCAPRSRAGA